MNPSDKIIADAIAKLQAAGKLPTGLTPKQISLLTQSLNKYSGQVSQKVLADILADFQSKIQTASANLPAIQMRGILADLTPAVIEEHLVDQLKFALHISQQVASGAGEFMQQNMNEEVLDEFPALELKRMFQREVPRGYARGKGGTLIEVPDDDWPSRWEAAGGELTEDGRMVALKSDSIWQALGDGEGGYDDTLGNPYPPFAFNSGFMTTEVSRAEAEQLGLLDEGEPAKPNPLDLGKLFSPIA